jgi:hypothetical protein
MLHVLPSEKVGFGGDPTAEETWSVSAFRERFEPKSVTVTYPVGLFKGKSTPAEAYHDEAHLNPKGHAIYADYLVESVTTSSVRFKLWRAKSHASTSQ